MTVPSCTHLAPNCVRVDVTDDLTLWFSYQTLVAFRHKEYTIVHTNDWGPTTGKHLNHIDGGESREKARRKDAETFADLYRRLVTDAK